MYTKEGGKYMNRLWTETLEELDFPEVRKALQAIGGEAAA
jgi:hypothetical protein